MPSHDRNPPPARASCLLISAFPVHSTSFSHKTSPNKRLRNVWKCEKTLTCDLDELCLMMMMIDDDDDDDDDDDVVLYSAVTPCYCSMLGALGRVVNSEACCPMGAV